MSDEPEDLFDLARSALHHSCKSFKRAAEALEEALDQLEAHDEALDPADLRKRIDEYGKSLKMVLDFDSHIIKQRLGGRDALAEVFDIEAARCEISLRLARIIERG